MISTTLKMEDHSNYLFTSERLGFRNWEVSDLDFLHAMNSDEEVMAHFPSLPSREESLAFIQRMQGQFQQKGFCYFAVELLQSSEFIGFIGLSDQTYEAPFTPCTDIGWRLMKQHWIRGFATEGAFRCLRFAKENLGMTSIKSVAPIVNKPSIEVMKKIGMSYQYNFKHPRLKDFPRLEECVLYSIEL